MIPRHQKRSTGTEFYEVNDINRYLNLQWGFEGKFWCRNSAGICRLREEDCQYGKKQA